MRPRPKFIETEEMKKNWVTHAHELAKFREEERAWFEELLIHPHVQEVMNIPPDEPIFVLRSQDIYSAETADYWLQVAQRTVGVEKFGKAAVRYKEMLEWQNVEPTRAKIPD